ncbi:hypothetical protein Ddc_16542 [Ditylenchus destructor]|nr:hypothetical protein Ddc_16542 [Ditylenchus destructor]
MDNGTLVDAFKFLNYMQLAKSSFVSKRFRNLIRTHRHSLARLYVAECFMRRIYEGTHNLTIDGPAYINMFGKMLSPEDYNEWVIHNQYSRQIPFESHGAGCSTKDDRKFYHFMAFVDSSTAVFDAQFELNHENSPLFQHFVRLITDPFVYFFRMTLTPQNDVLNLLTGEINPDFCHLRCNIFELNLDGDSQNFFSWIKDHVLCSEFQIWNYRSGCLSSGKLPEAVLIDFFLTGALCTSEFKVKYGTYPFKIIIEFVQVNYFLP